MTRIKHDSTHTLSLNKTKLQELESTGQDSGKTTTQPVYCNSCRLSMRRRSDDRNYYKMTREVYLLSRRDPVPMFTVTSVFTASVFLGGT